MGAVKNNCNNVITLKQYGSTCWFNSILMAVLYSDNSRKLLLKKSKSWNDKILIFKTIKYILKNKFLRTSNLYKDYQYFDKVRPEYILEKLYSYNKKKFNFNPKKYKSYLSSLYIRKIYKLLGVKVLYLDLFENNLYYSLYNNVSPSFNKDKNIVMKIKYVRQEKVMEKFEDPDVIIVNIGSLTKHYPYYYSVPKTSSFYSVAKLNDNVKINGAEYIQDSVLLGNWNKNSKVGHAIAGIKCKGERFVYNGWTRSTIDYHINDLKIVEDDAKNENLWLIKIEDKQIVYINTKTKVVSSYLPKGGKVIGNNIDIPCELMKYGWDVKTDSDFCLNLAKCALDLHGDKSIMNLQNKKLCFSFNKGNRQVIYVNKNSSALDMSSASTSVSSKKNSMNSMNSKNSKKCPEGKVRNPATGRCINIKTLNAVRKNPINGFEKKCPEGKVINPKTGRCIKIKN